MHSELLMALEYNEWKTAFRCRGILENIPANILIVLGMRGSRN
jgi:hypothetical protein